MKVLHTEFNYVYGSLPVSDMNQIQTSAKPTPVQTDCFTFLCPLDLFYWKMYEPFTPSGMEYYFCSILQSDFFWGQAEAGRIQVSFCQSNAHAFSAASIGMSSF